MNNSRNNEPALGISLGDIYFVVFRHKWKIILLTVAGLLAATGYYLTGQPPYQSEAKLLIRYISDTRTLNPAENNSRVTSLTELGQSLMYSETEILTSFDLSALVATNVGPGKILEKYGGGNDPLRAAFMVKSQLKVEPSIGSSVMRITFRHPDPALVQPILNEIIRAYLEKHAQVHQAIGLSDDLLTEQITQLRLQIAQTDDELRIVRTNAGIIDITDSQKACSEEVARIHRELLQAEAELAGREYSSETNAVKPTNSAPLVIVPPAEVAQYKTVCARLDFLEKKENEYLLQKGYTAENSLVKEVHDQIAATTKTKQDLEEKNPGLLDVPVEAPVSIAANPLNNSLNNALLIALPKRVKILQQQLVQLQADAAKLEDVGAKIADLQRKKQVQENSYKYFANSLEEAQIREALGPGHIDGIKKIQEPSQPFKEYGSFHKNIVVLILGGLFAGLTWAFLIEYYFDRSVKRSVEVETKLHLPCFISIPDLNRNKSSAKAASARRHVDSDEPPNSVISMVPAPGPLAAGDWQINHALDTHSDALRDRLVLYFESINLTRKPKLVAITSTDKGAGVSTIAAGLAASLSETGDGRVLLVDMNRENGAAQQFFNGKPNCKLDDALLSDKRDNAMVQDNLYVVTESSHSDRLTRVLPKRFATLVPQLKTSDYDYIIFDMPPVTQTSVTTRLAGFMDTVMLVIEAEKTDRETVQQANELLAKSKANVGAILNKTHQYVPKRLTHDINAKF